MDFAPHDALERWMQAWWLLVLAMLLGGLGGWVSRRFLPPVYESLVIISITVDYDETGPISERDVDLLQAAAGNQLVSQRVFADVVQAAEAGGLALDPAGLLNMVFVQRTRSNWEIRMRHSDPVTAELLARALGAAAMRALEDVHVHAVQVQVWQDYLAALAVCEAGGAVCQTTASTLQDETAQAAAALEQEIRLSNGMPPYMLYGLAEPGTPAQVVLFPLNTLVLAGAALGLLVGVGGVAGLGRRNRPSDGIQPSQ